MTLPDPTTFIDIHSHHPYREAGIFRVFNVFTSGFPDLPAEMHLSIGLHPWHLSAEAIEKMPGIIRKAASYESIIAIGEAGLDKLIKTPFEIQMEAFQRQIELSIELQKPLIVHCVRAIPELMDMRKRYPEGPAWIIHGFNASPALAEEVTRQGIHISIGLRLLSSPAKAAEILKKVPVSLIFAETDDNPTGIAEIYRMIAGYYDISVDKLKEEICSNFGRIFENQLLISS